MSRVASSFGGLAVAAALLTPTPAYAYRTFADDPEVGFAAVHPDASIRWDIAFGAIDTRDLVDIEAAAVSGLGTWGAPECSSVTSSFMGSRSGRAEPGDGLSTIEIVGSGWGDRGLDGERGAITDVRLVETADGWSIAEADVYVDFDTHSWTLEGAADGALDLQAVLTHEWGHVLGFGHPQAGDADAESSVMWPTYVGLTQRSLSADDVVGICALYPSAPVECDPVCTAGQHCEAGVCVTTCPGPDCCEGRACDEMCATDADCPAPSVCGLVGDDAGWCQPPGVFGAPCEVGSDCTSELCLVSMRSGAFCTQACRNDLDCPSGIPCQSVDGEDVCAPVLPSSSCAAHASSRSPALPAGIVLAALVCLAHRARRLPPRTGELR